MLLAWIGARLGESGVAAEVDGDHAEIGDISGWSACPDDAELEKFVTDHEYSFVRFAVVGIIVSDFFTP